MKAVEVIGGYPLNGEIKIQGSKNGILPVLAASVLQKGVCVLHNCPDIRDVRETLAILRELGAKCEMIKHTITIDTTGIQANEIPKEKTEKMRSSLLFLGALLGRFGEGVLGKAGGCNIGKRPIDIHLEAFQKMGALVEEQENFIAAKGRLRGVDITLRMPSVGATENIMIAAALAEGVTIIYNAAKEPEIVELANFLKKMGAEIYGEGSAAIIISGVKELHGIEYSIMPDRIVAGTYLLGAVATRGKVRLHQVNHEHLGAVKVILKQMGATIQEMPDGIYVNGEAAWRAVEKVKTEPYPGFPTDLQSVLLSTLTVAKGESCLYENIFENRYRTVTELRKMGADISVEDNRLKIHGVDSLYGCDIQGQELRGFAALVIAGLAAEGRTRIENKGYVERGYENIVRDLLGLGAKII